MRYLLCALILAACGGQPRPDGKEICGDGFDNDNDGLADCVDPDCAGVEVDLNGDGVVEPCPEFCTDNIDNDGDGLVDCEDPGCDGQGCPEVCDDGRDNDKDTRWDCDDSECQEVCDADGDGSYNADFGGDDCDDNNAAILPGATEICDGFDNDCNELVDLDDPMLDTSTLVDWFLDNDGDGYGQTGDVLEECTQPPGRVELDGDCNDTDPFVNPVATELCDGLDNDCDTLFDDADPDVDLYSASTWYPDNDGDGFGVNINPVDACTPPANHATNPDDCDDTNPTITSFGDWIFDSDGDGYGAGAAVGPTGCTPPGPGYVSQNSPIDCDDADPAVNPGAADPCGDGLDLDCDTLDCPNWFDGFEIGLPGVWNTGGDANWFAQTTTVHAGVYSGECGNIGDSQDSWISVSKSFPAGGTARFWHKGSTESGWDYFEFWVDGVEVQQWSGTWGWIETSYPVGPGSHDLEWRYQKDGSVSTGSDTVWLDDVELEGAIP